MTDNQYPVAMFRPEHTTYGIAYWPANSLAADLCGIAGVMKLNEERMHFVRKRFKVVEPSGQALPHPRKVELIA